MEKEISTKKIGDVVTNTIKMEMAVGDVMRKLGITILGQIEFLSIRKCSYDEIATIEITSKMQDRLAQIDYTKTI